MSPDPAVARALAAYEAAVDFWRIHGGDTVDDPNGPDIEELRGVYLQALADAGRAARGEGER